MISLVMEATKDTAWPISWAESKGHCDVRWGWFDNGMQRVRVGVQRVCDDLVMVHGADVETLELLWLQTKNARALMVVDAARKRPDWPTINVAGELEAEKLEPAPAPGVSGASKLDALEVDPDKGKLEVLSKSINEPFERWSDGKSP